MYREKVSTVHLNMWFCSFWPFVLFCDVFDRFLLLFDKSQASSGSINPFYASWASIWAQAQPSSSICLEDMSKTMAPIASKMQKKTTTFIITSNQLFSECPGWAISRWLGLVLQWHWRVRTIEKHSVLSFLPGDSEGGWRTKIWLWISSKFLIDKGVIEQWDSQYVNSLPRPKWLNESSKIYHSNITLNVRDKGLSGADSKRASVDYTATAGTAGGWSFSRVTLESKSAVRTPWNIRLSNRARAERQENQNIGKHLWVAI